MLGSGAKCSFTSLWLENIYTSIWIVVIRQRCDLFQLYHWLENYRRPKLKLEHLFIFIGAYTLNGTDASFCVKAPRRKIMFHEDSNQASY